MTLIIGGLGFAGYTANNFGVHADISYTNNSGDVDQYQFASLGGNLSGDIDSYSISSGLRTEYKFITDIVDISPHIGVRVNFIHTDSFDMSNAFGTVVSNGKLDATVWTFPIGVTFSKDIETSKSWNVQPQLDLNITPAGGDDCLQALEHFFVPVMERRLHSCHKNSTPPSQQTKFIVLKGSRFYVTDFMNLSSI